MKVILQALQTKLKGVKVENTLPTQPDGEYEALIPYSAWRAQMRFRRNLGMSVFKNPLKIVGFFLAIAAFIYCFIQYIPYKIFGIPSGLLFDILMYGYLLIIFYPVFTAPTNIQIGREGIRLHWLSILGLISSPWINFDYVDYVSTSKFRRGYYTSNAIDFYVDKRSVPANVRLALRLMAPSLWCISMPTKDTLKLRLDVSAITHESDLSVVLRTLKNLLPSEKFGAELLSLEDKPIDESFTKLWLDSLDGGDRLKLTMGPMEAGQTVFNGRFEIIDLLAQGGQAVTYLANDKDGVVVLKEFVLPVRGGMDVRHRAIEAVEHEAKLLKKLDNERIVKLLDCFTEGQRAYLVLEYIKGSSLRKLVQQNGPIPEPEAARLAISMCEALDYLHGQEPPIIHRDFTPENLLLRENGEVALIDFNVAEQLESNQTKTMVGKHCYVPPEQFRGKATIQSDIYACGCTLFWLLTADDPEPISTSSPSTKNANISQAMDLIVQNATAADAGKRYKSIKEMRESLERLTLQQASLSQ